jgi:alkylation response protein AidB-like acyl-CoA dehydrogenase
MDFKFSDEQNALRDQLLRFVQKDYGFEARKAFLKSDSGHSPAAWQQLADMGLLGLTLPEDAGGLGGNAVDTLAVMEVFGRGLVVEPYLATVVLGARLLADAGSAAQKALLEKVVAGELKLALAHDEPGARFSPSRVATTARSAGGGYVLDGAKTTVLHGAQADQLIVSARSSGGDRDEDGISLFLVERKAAGVSVTDYPTHDGLRTAEITFKQVKLGADALIGKAGAGFAPLEHALQRGSAALCAEAVGGMLALLEITGAYLKTRKQFGVPIGSFQVLQHRMADMLMAAEQARSMAYLAAARVDLPDAAERRRAIHAAKMLVGEKARFVGQQAVQLHGGIGVTDELNVSHYFKRLTLINAQLGDSDYHLGRYGALMAAA